MEPTYEIDKKEIPSKKEYYDYFVLHIKPYYKKSADETEELAETVFNLVNSCNNIIKISNKINPLDTLLLRTSSKHPKTLLEFAYGNENVSQIVEDILKYKCNEISDDDFIDCYVNQLFYNSINGHKLAIEKIRLILGKNFHIAVTQSYMPSFINWFNHNILYVNPLKLAILFENTPLFISYILNQINNIETFKEIFLHNNDDCKVLHIALYSNLVITNSVDYIKILLLILNIYNVFNEALDTSFIPIYFERKKLIVNKNEQVSNLCNTLEEKLLINDIDNYFEQCEKPLYIAKLYCSKLRKFLKLSRYYIVHRVCSS